MKSRYAAAALVMPRNVAAVLKGATYGATAAVPQVSAAFVQSMRDRDAREFWGSAVARPVAQGMPTGTRYEGGMSARARA